MVCGVTGAGQHGVALATSCALVGIPCEIHMGQVDIDKEHPNVTKMKILGCKLVAVTRGAATLKEAVDSAFEEYLKDPVNYFYAIGRCKMWSRILLLLLLLLLLQTSAITMATSITATSPRSPWLKAARLTAST